MADFDWIIREQRKYDALAKASLRWRDDIAASIDTASKVAAGLRYTERYRDLFQIDRNVLASVQAGLDVADRLRLNDTIAATLRGYDQIGIGLAKEIAPDLTGLIAQGTALSSVTRLQEQIAAIQSLPMEQIARFAEAQRIQFDEMVAAVRPTLIPAAMSSLFALETRLAGWDERQRRYDLALANHGWWFPPNLGASAFVEAGELALKGRKVELRRHMAAQVRGRKARWLVGSWFDEPLFRDRRRFLLDGARDHGNGRYRVSIPTLLPVIEGIAIAAFRGKSPETNPRMAVEEGVTTFGDAQDEALLEVVTFLWKKQDFMTFPGMSRLINRHVVLHGRSLGYGTESNSAQVIYALDHLHALVLAAGRLKAAAA